MVGRTGAGKSSLTQVLLRFVPLAGGRITIDGVDLATVPLWQLRTSVFVLTQNPAMFNGSVRFNRTFYDGCLFVRV